MKKVIINLKDKKVIEMQQDYIYITSIRDELNDTRTQFVMIGNYVFDKGVIDSVNVENIEEEE